MKRIELQQALECAQHVLTEAEFMVTRVQETLHEATDRDEDREGNLIVPVDADSDETVEVDPNDLNGIVRCGLENLAEAMEKLREERDIKMQW